MSHHCTSKPHCRPPKEIYKKKYTKKIAKLYRKKELYKKKMYSSKNVCYVNVYTTSVILCSKKSTGLSVLDLLTKL
jgi:hypothetical protein